MPGISRGLVRTSRRGLVTFVTCLAVGDSAFGRQAEGPQKSESGAPVVRVSVEVIQVDAVVTTKDGRQVSDLGPADFEILEDGRRQDITLCSFVPLEGRPATSGSPAGARSQEPDRRETIRRTMVFVVDDLSLGFRSTLAARQALDRFVDERMQPGDFVAILQTGAGSGALQQFTSDKRLLRATIARLRFNPAGRGAIAPLSIDGSGGNASAPAAGAGGSGAGDAAVAALAGRMNAFAAASLRQRQLHLAMGTMGALQSALRGLQQMPGRKSLVFLSEGFVQRDPWGERSDMYERLRAVTDLANRASVVVYAINPAGLETFGGGAEAAAPTSALSSRRAAEEARGGLSTLADDTGGLLLTDTNDIGGAVGRVLDDQSGYYLIGYVPDASLFKPDKSGPRYHKIQIKVRRPGLRVRSRKGFYAVASAGSEATEHEGLATAVYSPFAARDLGVRLTSLFGSDPNSGPYVRSLLHMDIQGITFQEQPDGSYQTELEIAVMTFGVDGFAVERLARSDKISIRPEFFEGAGRGGIVYTLDMPVKKPGPYQMRAAVRDVASARMGSASQFLEVPNLGADQLALSGLIMSGGATAEGNPASPAADVVDPDSTPAVRRFHRGTSVSYALAVYNAHTVSATGRPDLLVRLSLYRDDRLLQSMPILSFVGEGQSDPKRLALAGSFRLGATMEPGRYVLEVAVQDKAAGSKAGPVAQWMDFEVVD
jgi:VWFA-related protein